MLHRTTQPLRLLAREWPLSSERQTSGWVNLAAVIHPIHESRQVTVSQWQVILYIVRTGPSRAAAASMMACTMCSVQVGATEKGWPVFYAGLGCALYAQGCACSQLCCAVGLCINEKRRAARCAFMAVVCIGTVGASGASGHVAGTCCRPVGGLGPAPPAAVFIVKAPRCRCLRCRTLSFWLLLVVSAYMPTSRPLPSPLVTAAP